MEFFLGFAGSLVLLLLVGGGFVLGWKLKDRESRRRYTVTADAPAEDERRRLKAQQAAFNELQNYSIETAYGMNKTRLEESEVGG